MVRFMRLPQLEFNPVHQPLLTWTLFGLIALINVIHYLQAQFPL